MPLGPERYLREVCGRSSGIRAENYKTRMSDVRPTNWNEKETRKGRAGMKIVFTPAELEVLRLEAEEARASG